jgi:hypothetical protein
MPLRVVDGAEHVAYYKFDMELPPELEAAVVETPDKKNTAWERSVPLPAMLDWVERYAALTPVPPSR